MELPEDFVERTKPLLSSAWNEFIGALKADASISIRLNKTKIDREIDSPKVPWCSCGFYLDKRPQFTFDPLLHAGAYYVQEASSMFIERVVNQYVIGDVRALDLCAAPGGKSILLSSLLSDSSLLVSNEIIKSRANILSENLMKWGKPNCIVTNNKPKDYTVFKHFFDLILVDAPCSGEGMFRKDPQSINEWSIDNVLLCAQRQKDILSDVWSALKPGGCLVYSTCTYNREENEDIVAWVCKDLGASIKEVAIEESWSITESLVNNKATYHFYPHKTRGEGFYLAVLQKSDNGEIDESIFRVSKHKNTKKQQVNLTDYNHYLSDNESFTFSEKDGCITAFPTERIDDLNVLQTSLNIIHQGINLGQIKGKDFIPHQSLVLSNSLNKSSFDCYEVDWKTAIAFLRRESLVLPKAPKGIILLTYKNIALGFVKNLGNRANNLYPNEWRIRSANLPDSEVSVLEI